MAGEALAFLIRELARAAARAVPQRRGSRSSTLRPGLRTPMWNAVVITVRPLLARRGEKVKLARLLGVPRQRLHEFFVAKSAMPDAERTLLLLHWLSQRAAGVKPG